MQLTPRADDAEEAGHSLAEKAAAASRSTWVSVAVNLVLTTTQIATGILSKSQGLVADGIHSLSDLVADFVVLVANHHSRKDADADHPYGHHRFETAASLVLGTLLLAVGLGMLWSAFLKLVAGNLAGYPILDPIAAAIVGFMVTKMGWQFGWDALHDLMDRSFDEAEVAAIRGTLEATPGIQGVHDIRTRKMGDMIIVDAHIEVDATLSVEAGHDIAVEARNRVMQRHRVLNLMTHVDPWPS